MSFFSKMNKEIGGLFDKDKKTEEQGLAQRGYEQPYSVPQYGSPALQQPYGAPLPNPQYGGPQYGTPPQQYYQTPSAQPPPPSVPQGWLPLWDPSGQRWAFLELSTNQVSWNIPTTTSYGTPRGGPEYGALSGQGCGAPGGGYGGERKKDGKGSMMLGAAGGLAAGAIGGAVLANVLDDDDHQGGCGYPHGGDYAQGANPLVNAPLPDETASGSSVSSSDRESLEEAREEYQEEYEEAYGSD